MILTFYLHIPLHVCPNYLHTGLTTATAPSGHQMAVLTWDLSIQRQFFCVHRYMLAIESRKALEEYVSELLDPSNPQQRRFIQELLDKWRPPRQLSVPQGAQVRHSNTHMLSVSDLSFVKITVTGSFNICTHITMRCCYNVIEFLEITRNRHPKALTAS